MVASLRDTLEQAAARRNHACAKIGSRSEEEIAAAKDRCKVIEPTRAEQRRARVRRTQARIITRRDRELQLHGRLGARGLTVRRSGSLYDLLDGRAVVVDGAELDQLERWFDVADYD